MLWWKQAITKEHGTWCWNSHSPLVGHGHHWAHLQLDREAWSLRCAVGIPFLWFSGVGGDRFARAYSPGLIRSGMFSAQVLYLSHVIMKEWIKWRLSCQQSTKMEPGGHGQSGAYAPLHLMEHEFDLGHHILKEHLHSKFLHSNSPSNQSHIDKNGFNLPAPNIILTKQLMQASSFSL